MRILHFNIRVTPVQSGILVDAVFNYENGRHNNWHAPGNEYEILVTEPGFIMKLFGSTLERRLDHAQKILLKRAEQKMKRNNKYCDYSIRHPKYM